MANIALLTGSFYDAIEVEIAQEAYNKASEEERKSLEEIQKLEKKVNTDYGPDEAFAKLVDQCIEFKEIEYVFLFTLTGGYRHVV